ncbi:YbaB/EbfC DNA-binding family protein [Micromonospora matsumotoense]|uniref:YbaB/EbfC DNA-binding family protein n=1 Tax=Micromonospora matsumotoense TaxID=121616 RepID=A0A1C5A4I2_9ACTN|nr:YbaB/EbfC family nucleoid-associated protein [Micromonospora matsumotoense]SCF40108.1 YbaB/EbfC DNA-binding family protein [Micromonospora matsumotoense]
MSFNDRMEELFAEYERQRNSVTELQERMKEVRASATSPRREVTVTVGQNGVITDIAFPTSAYRRMTPLALQTSIMQTFTEAKEQVMVQAANLLAPLLPEGVDAAKVVRGEAGVDMFLPPEGPRINSSFREILGPRPEQP